MVLFQRGRNARIRTLFNPIVACFVQRGGVGRRVVLDRLLALDVGIQRLVPFEGRFRNEQEYKWQHSTAEDSDEIEGPRPANGMSDLSHQNGRKKSSTKKGKIRAGHTFASFLYHISVGCPVCAFSGQHCGHT